MTTTIDPAAATDSSDFKVADLSLAEFGRKEIELAEIEMPGLMALRERYGATKPLTGARITGSLHMTIQTAVLIETLVALGAEVRWASATSSPRRITLPPPSLPPASRSLPGGMTNEEFEWCIDQTLSWPADGTGSLLEHDPRRRWRPDADRPQGRRVRACAWCPTLRPLRPTSSPSSSASCATCSPTTTAARYRMAEGMLGVSEETTTGVHRLYQMMETRRADVPRH